MKAHHIYFDIEDTEQIFRYYKAKLMKLVTGFGVKVGGSTTCLCLCYFQVLFSVFFSVPTLIPLSELNQHALAVVFCRLKRGFYNADVS